MSVKKISTIPFLFPARALKAAAMFWIRCGDRGDREGFESRVKKSQSPTCLDCRCLLSIESWTYRSTTKKNHKFPSRVYVLPRLPCLESKWMDFIFFPGADVEFFKLHCFFTTIHSTQHTYFRKSAPGESTVYYSLVLGRSSRNLRKGLGSYRLDVGQQGSRRRDLTARPTMPLPIGHGRGMGRKPIHLRCDTAIAAEAGEATHVLQV